MMFPKNYHSDSSSQTHFTLAREVVNMLPPPLYTAVAVQTNTILRGHLDLIYIAIFEIISHLFNMQRYKSLKFRSNLVII